MNQKGHTPVLVSEFLSFFEGMKLKVFVDGTLGAGGHAEALLTAHPEIEQFIGFDQDQYSIDCATERLKGFGAKVKIVKKNFCEMKEHLEKEQIPQVDGIFLDIGVSSMQLDQAERGFSFSKKGPLDMRMDRSCSLTAKEIVNHWPEKKLSELFIEFGDLPKGKLIAQKIVEERRKRQIETTEELVELLSPYMKKSSKKSIHPLTLVFQALRIAVNNELEVLEYVLPKALSLLKPGGRFGIICFHSGEDRIVKNCFRQVAQSKESTLSDSEFLLLTKKPVVPSDLECKKNPRARSAKMRFMERI